MSRRNSTACLVPTGRSPIVPPPWVSHSLICLPVSTDAHQASPGHNFRGAGDKGLKRAGSTLTIHQCGQQHTTTLTLAWPLLPASQPEALCLMLFVWSLYAAWWFTPKRKGTSFSSAVYKSISKTRCYFQRLCLCVASRFLLQTIWTSSQYKRSGGEVHTI